MANKYVCVHGHFYQPPRENPWLEAVECQDSAFPYHDWNERVTTECYAANAVSRTLDGQGMITGLVNNYECISFNFGPTLLLWMQNYASEAYWSILEADKRSRARFGGHGSALAQAYNHMIMPLANPRDRRTQVKWGITDFEYRFGRRPEGMWLPETAVDLDSLEALAEHGITFTILAPRQAHRIRPLAGGDWQDVTDSRIDPTMPYLAKLPSGKTIALYFYDGPISQAVAFEGLLDNGDAFAARLMSGFPQDQDSDRLVHIATDGESYGHHHRGGEMALTRALDAIDSGGQAVLTNYAQYLESHPPTHEVEIYENSSWSCVHGVERWKADCGCNAGGHPGWNQSWRAPLREAMDWLRDAAASEYEKAARGLLKDPWLARDEYIDVLVERTDERVGAFLDRHAVRRLNPGEEIEVFKLLELQRHAMLMYTSCGWFFDELSGIETVQVIMYAGRVIQLCGELFHGVLESEFLSRLEKAKSNIPEFKDGRSIFERFVRPAMLGLINVGEHFAISSLFEDVGSLRKIFSYAVESQEFRSSQVGNTKMATGRVRVTSDVTKESATFGYGVLHLGDHNINCGLAEHSNPRAFLKLVEDMSKAFAMADLTKTMIILNDFFKDATCNLVSLFTDEKRKVLDIIMASTMQEAQAAYDAIYEHHAPLIRFLKGTGSPMPKLLAAAAEYSLNASLARAFQQEDPQPDAVKALLEEARLAGAPLDGPGLGKILTTSLEAMADRLFEDPSDLARLDRLLRAAILARDVPFEVYQRRPQTLCFKILHTNLPNWRDKAAAGDELAREWVELAAKLAETFSIHLP